MPQYRLSREAQADVKGIQLYTKEQWGKEKAKHYLIGLMAAFEKLARLPHLGRRRDDIDEEIYSFLAMQHIVFYRQGRDGLEIARVLHPSMDVVPHMDSPKREEES